MIKWGSLLVIGLMLLSGVAVFFAGQGNQDPGVQPSPSEQPLESFTAEEVEGMVLEIFPSAIVGGTTSESDKTVIDEAVQGLPGVRRVQSQFTKLSAEDNTLTYIANVSLEEGVGMESFAQAVEAAGLFVVPEVYFQASVSVPTKIQALSEKKETKSITLPNSKIQGIVYPFTLSNDAISGRLSASFQGGKLVSAVLVETQNRSAAPTQLSFSGDYPLSLLRDTLTITGSLHYFPSLSKHTIKSGLQNIQGVSSVDEPIVPQVNNTLSIQFKEAAVVFEDVNAFASSNPEKYSSVSLGENALRVGLNDVSVLLAKQELQDVIVESLLSNVELVFVEPETQFLVDVNVSTPDMISLTQKMNEYFFSWDDNASIRVFQNGLVDVNALFSPDTNEAYALDNGQLPVSVKPGHQTGDLVRLEIDAIAIRGKLVYVNGVEDESSTLGQGN